MSRMHLCVALLTLAPAAFTQPLRTEASGRPGGELTISQRGEPRTLNPLLALDNASRDLIRLTMGDLVHINRQTLRTEPSLAHSWKTSPDGKTITVYLRRGIRFSDGAAFSARDVLFTFAAHLDEKLASPQRDLLLVGGKPVALQKIDDHTVRFTFAEPYAPAERLFDSLYILPSHVLEPLYREGKLADAWKLSASPASFAGLGPFVFKSHVPGQSVSFERNPHFWQTDAKGKQLPYLERVTVRFFADQDAEVLRFRGGSIDLLSRVPAQTYAALSTELKPRGYQFGTAGPGLEYHFLFFNLNSPASVPEPVRGRQAWFSIKGFRRAVSLCMDRESVQRIVYAGFAEPIWQPVSPGNRRWFNASLPAPPPSTEKARALLRASGFRWNEAGALLDASGRRVEFSLAVNAANSQHSRIAALLQQDLQQLGISMQVVPLEFRSLVDRVLKTRDYDAALMALLPGDADPGPDMTVWLLDGRSRFWNLSPSSPEPWERETDRLMRAQMTTTDPRERKRLFDLVQRTASEELPFICIVSPHVLAAAKPGLRNWRLSILPPYAMGSVAEMYWEARP